MQERVMIAGGGIGGMSLALTLDQIGVPFVVFESVQNLKPLGVGINVQPNAIRELYDLGFTDDDLRAVGIPAKEWAMVGFNGKDIYAEPRGTYAGYKWPQYAMHRGKFHMMLYHALIERAGPDVVRLGSRVAGYHNNTDGTVTAEVSEGDGSVVHEKGTVLIGADGLHSAVRSTMHPDQPEPHWGGALLWRGTSRARPVRTGSSFIGLGTNKQRMVIYPISEPDSDGLAEVNWIAEVTFDDPEVRQKGWYKPAPISDFVHFFEDWRYDWLDVPALIRGADFAYETPMIDRDPIPTWVDGAVALLGDAAHVMYPTGSNGASQAIIDGRTLASKFLAFGVTAEALRAYDTQLCGPVSEVVLRNRGDGPFGLIHKVYDQCGGVFDEIDDVISAAERREFMQAYKAAAGFEMERLNAAPSILGPACEQNRL